MEIQKNATYFPALTGIRAIAAYMVFLTHYNPFRKEWLSGIPWEMTSKMYVGVNFFFVLSGFLIAVKYYDSGGLSFGSYFYRRFVRIYPLFFLVTTATFLISFIRNGHESLIHFFSFYLLCISFLNAFFSDFFYSHLQQSWSLTVEETFYLCAPFIFLLVKKSRWTLLFFPVILLGTGVMLVGIFSKVDFFGFMGNYRLLLSGTFFGRATEFFLGIFLGIVVLNNKKDRKALSFTYGGLLAVAVGIYVIPVLTTTDVDQTYLTAISLRNFIIPVFIALFYYGLIYEKTILSTILSSRLFQLLGKSSYSFYLIHVGNVASAIKMFTGSKWLLFVSLIIVSILLYLFVEEPIRKYLLRKPT